MPEPLAPVQARPGPAASCGSGQVPTAAGAGRLRSWAEATRRRRACGAGAADRGTAGARPPPDDADEATPPPDGAARPRAAHRDERIERLPAGWSSSTAGSTTACAPGSPTRRWPATPRGTSSPPGSSTPGPGALANRVRRLAGVVGAPPDWHEQRARRAGRPAPPRRRPASGSPSLPRRPRRRGRDACGWQVRQADVAGRRAGDRHAGSSPVAATPARTASRCAACGCAGSTLGRWAMVLSFAAYRQSLDTSLDVGTVILADLHRYPGLDAAGPGRQVLERPADPTTRSPRRRRSPPPSTARAPRSAGCSAAEPWLDRVPVTLVAAPTLGDGGWVLTDHTGSLRSRAEAARAGHARWPAAAGGRPVTVTVRVDPSGVRAAHRAPRPIAPLDIGPRADLVVRERGMTATAGRHVGRAGHRRAARHRPARSARADRPAPLADLVADALAPDAAGTAAGRRWRRASPPGVPGCCRSRRPRPLMPPDADGRPMLPAAAARRWVAVVADWPVLEDEWLPLRRAHGGGRRPTSWSALLRRHRTEPARRARHRRSAGRVAPWLHRAPARPASPTHAARQPSRRPSSRACPCRAELEPLLGGRPDAHRARRCVSGLG